MTFLLCWIVASWRCGWLAYVAYAENWLARRPVLTKTVVAVAGALLLCN